MNADTCQLLDKAKRRRKPALSNNWSVKVTE